MHMRTTMNLSDELVARAARETGITEKTKLVHKGLEALIAEEARKRLSALGGKIPGAWAPARQRKIK